MQFVLNHYKNVYVIRLNNIIFNFHKAYNGQQFAEQFVIVESNLSVRQKTPTSSKRITREAPLPSLIISRIKRQFQSQPNVNKFGSSQSTAQSNSHAHDFGPFGFQTADALAGAQGKS